MRALQSITLILLVVTGCSRPPSQDEGGSGDVTTTPSFHLSQNSSSAGGYTPAQMSHFYGLDKLSDKAGAGFTIAIVDAYDHPKILDDVNAFSTQYSLPQMTGTSLTIAYASGSAPAQDKSWDIETSLDVEWAHAMAPQANILLVEAQSAQLSDLMAAVEYAAQKDVHVVSMSFGGNEFSGQTQYDQIFQKYPQTTFVAAAGDNGRVSYPSSSPFVLAVGGTTLKLDSQGNLLSPETPWYDCKRVNGRDICPIGGAGGGGTSLYEAIPDFQKNAISGLVAAYAGAADYRSTPDIATVGNPNTGVVVTYQDGTASAVVGGTSVGTPIIAALIGREYNEILAAGKTPAYNVEFNTFIYSSPSLYYDVATGPIATGQSQSGAGYSYAIPGYDTGTGMGALESIAGFFSAFPN